MRKNRGGTGTRERARGSQKAYGSAVAGSRADRGEAQVIRRWRVDRDGFGNRIVPMYFRTRRAALRVRGGPPVLVELPSRSACADDASPFLSTGDGF